jgi:hypothetical protein
MEAKPKAAAQAKTAAEAKTSLDAQRANPLAPNPKPKTLLDAGRELPKLTRPGDQRRPDGSIYNAQFTEQNRSFRWCCDGETQ